MVKKRFPLFAFLSPCEIPTHSAGTSVISALLEGFYNEGIGENAPNIYIFPVVHMVNVTGPPEALLFDRDQRSH